MGRHIFLTYKCVEIINILEYLFKEYRDRKAKKLPGGGVDRSLKNP
jgi:hypothetical protein